jgi:hypothetical protein
MEQSPLMEAMLRLRKYCRTKKALEAWLDVEFISSEIELAYMKLLDEKVKRDEYLALAKRFNLEVKKPNVEALL